MYQADVCTIPANLAGLPAITVPCGLRRRATHRAAGDCTAVGGGAPVPRRIGWSKRWGVPAAL